MASVHITQPFMTVESACWQHLVEQVGKDRAAKLGASGFVESTLDANPGLADAVALNEDSLPLNTVIVMPEVPQENIRETVHLWDDPDAS